MTGLQIVLFFFGLFVLLLLYFMSQASHDAIQLSKSLVFNGDKQRFSLASLQARLSDANNFIYAGIVVLLLAVLWLGYGFVKGSIYEGHLLEWLNLVVRWMHITFGIAWIGTSFFFVFMENSLAKNLDRPELKGNLWMLHGGGFWFVEKYQVAPASMPKGVHWFKYEAYFTWLSGFALLCIVYYFNAEGMLVDSNKVDLSSSLAIAISMASLILGYAIYHFLSLTGLLKKPLLFGIVLFSILIGFAYFYNLIFTARAAYIHFGALIGTFMAGNVFFVIIPGQKRMVQATIDGTYLDPWIGQFAGLRSFHNNYFTLPVLFVMISNHFPSTFGNEQPWLILALLALAGAGVKHYLNLKEKHQQSVWVMPISILILISAVFISAPQPVGGTCDEVSFAEVYPIFQERCVSCHSASPTDKVYTTAPNGVTYDTPQDIVKLTDKIMQRVVITKTMPLNNQTGITPEERDAIRCWIDQGSVIE